MNISTLKLLRYLVAYIFITSGIMKFMSPELAQYFTSLGLPIKLMYVVAITELICGGFILFDRRVKMATIPLFIIMIAAFLLTKVPVLHTGLLPFAFNARLDILMLGLLFILFTQSRRY